MKSHILIYLLQFTLLTILIGCNMSAQKGRTLETPDGLPARIVAIYTMDIKNPFIYLDRENLTYYMTGDGGYLWTSKDLKLWNGAYNILQYDTTVWYGVSPVITAPEIHKFNNKFYFVATFTLPDNIIDNVNGKNIPRRSCEILVADSIQGPYKPITTAQPLLRADQAAQSATFITDEYGWGYIIYNHDWQQCMNGTTQIIMLTKDLAEQIGDPFTMFKASQNPWSTNNGNIGNNSFSPMMEGPFLFDTEGRELGILFITEKNGEKALGVAYTEKDHGLNGPWHIEPEPMLTGNYGQAMLFNDFDGSLVMVLHKDTIINGDKKSIPQLFEMDSQYDKLKIKSKYNI